MRGRSTGGRAESWWETGDRVSAGPADVVCRAAACRQRSSARRGSDDPVGRGSQLRSPWSCSGRRRLRPAFSEVRLPHSDAAHSDAPHGAAPHSDTGHPQSYWLALAALRRSGPFMLIGQWGVYQLGGCDMSNVRILLPTHEPSAEWMANTAMSSSMGASAIRLSQSGSVRWCVALVTRVTRASRSSVRALPRRSIRPSV